MYVCTGRIYIDIRISYSQISVSMAKIQYQSGSTQKTPPIVSRNLVWATLLSAEGDLMELTVLLDSILKAHVGCEVASEADSKCCSFSWFCAQHCFHSANSKFTLGMAKQAAVSVYKNTNWTLVNSANLLCHDCIGVV